MACGDRDQLQSSCRDLIHERDKRPHPWAVGRLLKKEPPCGDAKAFWRRGCYLSNSLHDSYHGYSGTPCQAFGRHRGVVNLKGCIRGCWLVWSFTTSIGFEGMAATCCNQIWHNLRRRESGETCLARSCQPIPAQPPSSQGWWASWWRPCRPWPAASTNRSKSTSPRGCSSSPGLSRGLPGPPNVRPAGGAPDGSSQNRSL